MIGSLEHMGYNRSFYNIVKTLLGNASTRVCVNGDLADFFSRQDPSHKGACLLPPLHAIVGDGLNWLLQSSIQANELKGIQTSEGKHICIGVFANGTNAMIANKE